MTELARYLEWDSNFFGRRIARATCSRLHEHTTAELLSWCAAEQIDCLYLLADSDDAKTVQLAQAHQFEFVDIRLTLERKTPQPLSSPIAAVRPFTASDIPALKAIARVTHHDTRYYYDPHFPDALCDRFYETWIENSCNGFADQVLVASDNGTPAGYITCHLNAASGDIGLLAVSASAQGKGYGTQLIHAALQWFAEQNVETVSVVTQGRNVRAQRVYQKNGFLTKSVSLWYHRWF